MMKVHKYHVVFYTNKMENDSKILKFEDINRIYFGSFDLIKVNKYLNK